MAALSQFQNTLTNQTAVAPISQPQGTSKKQFKKNDPYKCILCESRRHNAGNCPDFPTLKQKTTQLYELYKCEKCAHLYGNGKHTCNPNIVCKYCGGRHRNWLCPGPKQQSK